MKIIAKKGTAAAKSAPIVQVKPIQLVILLLMQIEPMIGIALSASALLRGGGGDVWEMLKENLG